MNVTERTQFLTDGNPVEELTVEGSRFDRISILADDGINKIVVRAREVGTGDVVEQPFRKVSGQLFKPVTPVETHRRDVDDDIQDALASIGYAPVDEPMLDDESPEDDEQSSSLSGESSESPEDDERSESLSGESSESSKDDERSESLSGESVESPEDDEQSSSLFGDDVTPVPEGTTIDVSGIVDEGQSAYSDTRQAREEYPAPVAWLVETGSDRILLDWAIELYLTGDDSAYTKYGIAEETGISRKTVGRRIHKHIEIGVFGVDHSQQYERFFVREGPVIRALVALNEAVLVAYPDDPADLPES